MGGREGQGGRREGGWEGGREGGREGGEYENKNFIVHDVD